MTTYKGNQLIFELLCTRARRYNEKGRVSSAFSFNVYFLLRFVFNVTIPAVYRLVAAGLEGDFCLLAALCAGSREHLARATAHTAAATTTAAAIAITLRSSVLPAGRATLGFISITLGCKKFLLFYREGERFSAIGTLETFLLECHSDDLLTYFLGSCWGHPMLGESQKF